MSEPFVVKVDADAVLGLFRAMADFTPKAVVAAMNRSAEEANAAGRRRAVESFTIREPKVLSYAFPRTLPRGEAATERKMRITLEPTRNGVLLEPFEEGRPHGPDRLGRWPAMPSYGPGGLRETKATVIPRSIYPVNLGLQPRAHINPKDGTYYALGRNSIKKNLTPYSTVGGKQVKQGRFGTYEVAGKNGKRLIFQRRQGPAQKGGGGPKGILLWVLKPSVRRPKVLHFVDTLSATLNTRWPINLNGFWAIYQRIAERRAQR